MKSELEVKNELIFWKNVSLKDSISDAVTEMLGWVFEDSVKRYRCVRCNILFTGDKITYGPDPYALDIENDRTNVWECKNCSYERSMDI